MTSTYDVISGNAAAAHAARLSRSEVVSAYPISPQTSIVETIANFIHKDLMRCEYIKVESEHSAMAACIGAAIGGARAFTATSSQGLLLMQEMLYWAAYGRCPITMAVVTRSIAPPWNMWSEHTDAFSQRDSGWIQLFCSSNQEILDTVIQAYKVSEDKRVLLPIMVCYDGFELSHTAEAVNLPDQGDVDIFLPSYHCDLIDPANPRLLWNGAFPKDTVGFRKVLLDAMEASRGVIGEAHSEFERRFGRTYRMIESYGSEEADIGIVAMGSVAGVARQAVDRLREKSVKAKMIRVRCFRPFPDAEIRRFTEGMETLLVLDRDTSFGQGVLAGEIKASLYSLPRRPKVYGFRVGLGGVGVTSEEVVSLCSHVQEKVREGSLQETSELFTPLRRGV